VKAEIDSVEAKMANPAKKAEHAGVKAETAIAEAKADILKWMVGAIAFRPSRRLGPSSRPSSFSRNNCPHLRVNGGDSPLVVKSSEQGSQPQDWGGHGKIGDNGPVGICAACDIECGSFALRRSGDEQRAWGERGSGRCESESARFFA
jgi:hypothetical protein